MIRELDRQRADRGLDWNRLAVELHAQSGALNAAALRDHDLCSGALVRTARRGTMSCQYALIILRWVGRDPEDFLTHTSTAIGDTRLPVAGADRRLRWNLPLLHLALNQHRQEHASTWAALAGHLHCTPNRLTNLKSARLADMDLTMRITQHLRRPAAHFAEPACW